MTKKRFVFCVSALFACFLSVTGPVYADMVDPFTDVSADHEYGAAVEYLHSLDILRGDDGKGTYRPEDGLNRAEFAAILSRVAGNEPSADIYHDCFPDVGTEWFAPYVCYAMAEGLVKGYEAGPMAGHYGPSESLLNAEIVVVLARVAGWETAGGGEWYEPAWNYATARKIVENAEFAAKTVRGLMAELIFRTAVVKEYALAEYDAAKAGEFTQSGLGVVEAIGFVSGLQELDITVTLLPDLAVGDDETGVPVFKFAATLPSGQGSAEIKGIRFHLYDAASTGNLARLYLKNDQTGEVLFERDIKFMTVPSPFIVMFDSPIVLSAAKADSYTLFADFDYETADPVRLYVSGAEDFNTGANVKGQFPMYGAKITRDPGIYDAGEDPAKMEMCASWDPEYNLPYPSQNGSIDYNKKVPGEGGGTVAPGEGAHIVLPIDQGNEGICAAAAVYSSMRWLEEKLGKDFIENGKAGLDALIEALYKDVHDTDTQDEKLVEYLEGLNKCIDVEYDTQAGSNVACSELLEYKEKGCDIPLSFRCEALDPETGEVATGDDAEEWGHRVDLVDVVVDPADSNKCTITFANSWSDPKNPGKDLDGLGAGRYEKAAYNDDDESFDIESSWADFYRCRLRAAAYICVDEDC